MGEGQRHHPSGGPRDHGPADGGLRDPQSIQRNRTNSTRREKGQREGMRFESADKQKYAREKEKATWLCNFYLCCFVFCNPGMAFSLMSKRIITLSKIQVWAYCCGNELPLPRTAELGKLNAGSDWLKGRTGIQTKSRWALVSGLQFLTPLDTHTQHTY